jgi:acyl-CoA dehydrogenase
VVPPDQFGHEVAQCLIEPSATRDRLTSVCYVPNDVDEPVGALEAAMVATIEAEPVERKLREAQKAGHLTRGC